MLKFIPILKFLVLLATFIFAGCAPPVNIVDHLHKEAPLSLVIGDSAATLQAPVVIVPQSKKHSAFIAWAESATAGWQPTPASYLANVCVSQPGFKLLYSSEKEFAVVSFTDKDGEAKQYSKKTAKGELDFLTE